MVGIVVVAHGNLPEEFIKTASLIVHQPIPRIVAVSIDPSDTNHKVANNIKKAIAVVDDGDGVVIFTDMFGGTPSNISLSFLEAGRIEVISGVNLPMMLHIVTNREGASLTELGKALQAAGRENISLASDLFKAQ